MQNAVRAFSWMAFFLVLALLSNVAHGATYKLTNGKEVTGELLPSSATDAGVQIKVAEGQYERVLWGSFTQEDLKSFASNAKLQPLVEPFIEITQEERLKKTEFTVKAPQRLDLPASGSFIGAMFSSSLGLLVIVLLYAGTIYAGYEVAIFRAQPPFLVAGLAAIPVLGLLSPIVFLAMPTRMKSGEAAGEENATAAFAPEGTVAAAAAAAAAGTADPNNPMQNANVAHPGSLHLHHDEKKETTGKLPEPQVFQRGQFTFNRRFFETKFPGFFGVVRRDAEKDLVLVIKASRGKFVGQRISRIAANDLHLQVQHGAATEEVMIPFSEVQEIRVQHKDQQ